MDRTLSCTTCGKVFDLEDLLYDSDGDPSCPNCASKEVVWTDDGKPVKK